MSDVFISYSRRDLGFVAELSAHLEGEELDVWVDVEGLYAGEEFWPEVAKAIDAAVAVVFVITPDSVASRFCQREIQRAVDGGKRIVPVLRRDADETRLHPAVASRQWVLFRPSDDAAAGRRALLSAVRADWVRLRRQARLLVRAREWVDKGRDGSLLLRGSDLREAEAWLQESGGEEGATSLHEEYVAASRHATTRRRVRVAAVAAATLVIVAAITWFGLTQRVASLNNLSLDDLNRNRPQAALDKLERADALCDRFRRLFAGCPDAALNLSRAYLDARRYGAALERLSEVLAGAPDEGDGDALASGYRATAYQNRAYARIMVAELEAGDHEREALYRRAEEDLDRAAALFEHTPGGADSRPMAITRARIDLGRARYDQAHEELDRAGRVSDAEDIDLLLSLVYHCQGKGPRSALTFTRYMDRLGDDRNHPHWLQNKAYYSRIWQRCADARS